MKNKYPTQYSSTQPSELLKLKKDMIHHCGLYLKPVFNSKLIQFGGQSCINIQIHLHLLVGITKAGKHSKYTGPSWKGGRSTSILPTGCTTMGDLLTLRAPDETHYSRNVMRIKWLDRHHMHARAPGSQVRPQQHDYYSGHNHWSSCLWTMYD